MLCNKESHKFIIAFMIVFVGSPAAVLAINIYGTHFVETHAPNLVATGHPENDLRVREYHVKQFDTNGYEIKLFLPVQHFDSSLHGNHIVKLQVKSKKGDVMRFKIKKWELRSSLGKKIDGKMEIVGDLEGKGLVNINEMVGEEFHSRYVLPYDFKIYYPLPSNTKNLTLDFSLELYATEGVPKFVSQKMHLKRATYKKAL